MKAGKPISNFISSILDRNGHEVILEISGIPVLDNTGKLRGYRGIDRDITSRRLAERALRESEEKFRELAENIREVFWIRTSDKLLYISPTYEDVWGRSCASLYENPLSFLDAVHPDDKERVLHSSWARREQGGFNEEYRIFRPDGLMLWIWTRSFPVWKEGRVVRIVGISEDITERKLAEEELREYGNQLRQLSARLLATQEEERKRIAGELHDSIGGSLAAIKYGIENALQRMRQGDTLTPEFIDGLLRMTQSTIEDARRIYMDLRPAILDDLGILITIGWFTRRFQEIFAHIHIEQEIRIDEDDVPDPLKIVIFRIIQEAFHNITKYSKADLVRVSLLKRKDSMELTIADNGVGFDLSSVSARRANNGGLGLTSMRERVELSGGAFSIEATPGKGVSIWASWEPDKP